MSCEHCGWSNDGHARWCVNCGRAMRGVELPRDRVEVALSPARVEIEPGSEALAQVQARSLGDLVGQFALRVRGPAAPYAVLDAHEVHLMPGSQATVGLRFAVPRSPHPTAGTMPVLVEVLGRDVPVVVGQGEGQLVVAPFEEVAVRLVPSRRHAWREASYRLDLQSVGNIGSALTLAGQDPDDALRILVFPERLDLSPAERVVSEVKVRARALNVWGAVDERPFSVAVEGDRLERAEREARLLQRSLLTAWRLVLLALVVLVLVLALLVAGGNP